MAESIFPRVSNLPLSSDADCWLVVSLSPVDCPRVHFSTPTDFKHTAYEHCSIAIRPKIVELQLFGWGQIRKTRRWEERQSTTIAYKWQLITSSVQAYVPTQNRSTQLSALTFFEERVGCLYHPTAAWAVASSGRPFMVKCATSRWIYAPFNN